MEFRQIRYFLEIYRQGSYSKAAGALGLTQPALTRQMQLLERELKKPIFERANRTLRLTEAGKVLLEQALELNDLWKHTLALVQESSTGLYGIYAISAGGAVATRILPHALSRIRKLFPEVSFHVIEGDAHETVRAVLSGQVDLGILPEGDFAKSGLQERYFFTDRIVPVIGKNHPHARQLKNLSGNIYDQDFVFFHPASAIRKAVEARISGARKLRIVMELRSMESVVESVAAGMGAGFISELSMNAELIQLPIPELTLERKMYFVYRKTRHGINTLIELIEKMTLQGAGLPKKQRQKKPRQKKTDQSM